jgi:hypothetical protein
VDPRRLLDELVTVARRAGVEVRTETLRVPIRSSGGVCRVNGRTRVILDGRASPTERGIALADALAELGTELDDVEMSSQARTLIDRRRFRRSDYKVRGPGIVACRPKPAGARRGPAAQS